MRQSPENKRKNPRQKRARQTIDVIMEATAQLLERNGSAGFTTNHIARRAGYSIGTLYRYFPHKSAILKEMFETEIRNRETKVREALAQAECSSGEGVIELAVRTALEPFVTRSRVRRSMLLAVIHDTELVAKTSAAHKRIMHLILSRLVEIDPTRYREPTDLLCLTLCGALLGSIRTTLFVEPDYLRDPDYRRELTAMVTHFVTRRDEA